MKTLLCILGILWGHQLIGKEKLVKYIACTKDMVGEACKETAEEFTKLAEQINNIQKELESKGSELSKLKEQVANKEKGLGLASARVNFLMKDLSDPLEAARRLKDTAADTILNHGLEKSEQSLSSDVARHQGELRRFAFAKAKLAVTINRVNASNYERSRQLCERSWAVFVGRAQNVVNRIDELEHQISSYEALAKAYPKVGTNVTPEQLASAKEFLGDEFRQKWKPSAYEKSFASYFSSEYETVLQKLREAIK
ncbi:hypothetical protein [Pseudobacteriovorax antillogorgiicola]|uniref:Uncharacterized protein n=1 Tax=Pseudobacteriovorax antillogorgiicola TaxID=1513793 RepID=A0A1Y6CN64_9BACT|nr:hypothetical protein [Pseudobacteriovorax antillogorgiicola]TCS44988.1 hypothetical protein EDD56_13025 [Pseudobacteriovorax antillogorgiicola]SMF76645.1 hypothetical protein SAMN06296036_13049 [Pseudobacteriovorax antillogorgiicola]